MLILFVEWLAFLTGLVAWKSARPVYLRIIVALLGFTVLAENFEEWSAPAFKARNRMLLYNLHSLVEITAWFGFYRFVFAENRTMRRVIPVLAAMVLVFTAIEVLGYRGANRFHADSYRFYSVCVIFLSIRYLFTVLNAGHVYYPSREPVFWFAAGSIIFHLVFFVHLTVINIPEFTKDVESINTFVLLLTIANIAYYLLLCTGLCTTFFLRRRSAVPSSQA
jgi:hypothetical protein